MTDASSQRFDITVETSARRPRFRLDGKKVKLKRSGSGKPFTGSEQRSFNKDVPFRLRMNTWRGTSWKLTIKYGGKEVYNNGKSTDKVRYRFDDVIVKPPAPPPGPTVTTQENS